MTRNILITGATGRIGRNTLGALADSKNTSLRALVRDPAKAQTLESRGVRTFVGSFSDPAVLASATAGVDAVLLVSPVHPDQRELQGSVVRAAAAQGKPLIVKISGLGTALDSYVDSGRWHAEGELDIARSGLPYTFLRPNFFMQNLAFHLATARREGVIRASVGDARIAMVDVQDIAAVCARLLAGDAALPNQAVVPTSTESVSYHDVAQLVGSALGRSVRYEPQTLDQARASLSSSGQPDWHVEILLQFNRAFREGWGENTTSVVADVLGRPPISLGEHLLDAVRQLAQPTDDRDPFPS